MNSRIEGIITSLILIALGLWTRYTNDKGWRNAKPYWPYLVVIGAITLILEIVLIFMN